MTQARETMAEARVIAQTYGHLAEGIIAERIAELTFEGDVTGASQLKRIGRALGMLRDQQTFELMAKASRLTPRGGTGRS